MCAKNRSKNRIKKLISDINPLAYYGYAHEIDASEEYQATLRHERDNLGFDSTEIWNLDQTISKFLIPRLEAIRDTKNGFPDGIKSKKEWNELINEMIGGFQIIADGQFNSLDSKIEKSLKLFAKYFRCLWD